MVVEVTFHMLGHTPRTMGCRLQLCFPERNEVIVRVARFWQAWQICNLSPPKRCAGIHH